jgi:pantoate--beta-alanine ligase
MQIHHQIAELQAQLRGWRCAGKRIGFVPTMGNLHAGHLSLIERARASADIVLSSIFVNPTQFGAGEDYSRYPRTLEADCALLREAGCDAVLAPSVEEMYPDGADLRTVVRVDGLHDILCGAFRPGHFDGVATVVAKLFNLAQPDLAVFGEKDYQQFLVVKRMARELSFPIEIIGAPTAREANGLAMSSRNQYLSPAERQHASLLFRMLLATREALKSGARDYATLCEAALAELTSAGFRPDYFEIRRAADLAEPGPTDRDLVVLVAARLGGARLIDNLRVVAADVPSV